MYLLNYSESDLATETTSSFTTTTTSATTGFSTDVFCSAVSAAITDASVIAAFLAIVMLRNTASLKRKLLFNQLNIQYNDRLFNGV